MADAGWSIRVFKAGENTRGGTVAYYSTFQAFGDRQKDSLTIFNGMYGLDNYLVWETHRDFPDWDFSAVMLEVRLFMDRNNRRPYFDETYRVSVPPMYDKRTGKVVIYAVTEDTVRLQLKLNALDTFSVNIRDTEQVIDTVGNLLPHGVIILRKLIGDYFTIVYHADNAVQKYLVDREYQTFTPDPDWNVFDLIDYISVQNGYEWYIDHGQIHIGHELKADNNKNLTKPYDRQEDIRTYSMFFMKFISSASTMDIMGHYNKEWRCIWYKHFVGEKGGNTVGCFSPIGAGRVDKQLYESTLEGGKEKINASYVLHQDTITSESLLIGKVISDDGSGEVEEISTERDPNFLSKSLPKDIKVNMSEVEPVARMTGRASKLSQYMDNNAGLQFPVVEGAESANCIIGNVEGNTQSPVLLGYVPGNGDATYVIPKKNANDFRLQFPNGWCLYVKDDGETYLQLTDTSAAIVPVVDPAKTYLHLKPDGTIKINQDTNTYIEIAANGNITCSTDGDVRLEATGVGNVTTKGLQTKLQDGNSQLAHAFHTHNLATGLGNIGLPLIQSTTPCTDNTTTTRAD